MESSSLTAMAAEQLELARAATNGRSAHTLYGGRDQVLRQTLLALTAGHGLGEHGSPGEATLHVLRGRVRLTADGASWTGTDGDHVTIPPSRHSLDALDDSVILLTVANT